MDQEFVAGWGLSVSLAWVHLAGRSWPEEMVKSIHACTCVNECQVLSEVVVLSYSLLPRYYSLLILACRYCPLLFNEIPAQRPATMSDLLAQISSGLDLATTIGELAKGIRRGKASEKKEAREFADHLERLLDALRGLGRLREDTDGRITPTLRVDVMNAERRGWTMLHKIEATIVPLEHSGHRRKKVLKNFFMGGAGRQVVETNEIMKRQVREVENCKHNIDNHIRAYHVCNPSASCPNLPATSTRQLQRPPFWPLNSDADGNTGGAVVKF